MWARTLCPLSSSTLKKAFGSDSTTVPSISMAPSFLGMSSALHCWLVDPGCPGHPVLHGRAAALVADRTTAQRKQLRVASHSGMRSRTAPETGGPVETGTHPARGHGGRQLYGPHQSLLEPGPQCEPGPGLPA